MYSWCGISCLFALKLLLIQVVSSEIVSLEVGETIYEYDNSERLGRGFFSDVYKGRRMEEEKIDILAFKVAKRDIKDTIAVQHEKEIYEELGDHKSIPKFYHYFPADGNRRAILITEILGSSVFDLLDKYDRFSTATVMRIGLQALDALEHIHRHNVIHYDLNIQNLAVGYNNDSVIYLFDFNMSKKYRIRDGSIVIKGNLVNKRRHLVKSPRYDLISLSYTLVTMFFQDIPLDFVNNLWNRSFGTIHTNEELDIYLVEVECKEILKEFLKMANDPENDLPDYDAFRNVLITELEKHKHSPNYNKFEWQ